MASETKKTRKTTENRTASSTVVTFDLVSSPRGGKLLTLRSRLKLTRDVFARMLPVSTRSLAMIESGRAPSEAIGRKLTEVRRIVDALSAVVDAQIIGQWMTTPNDAFDGLKPLEVIERGEVDRIWQMIFLLRSGVPS